MSRNRWEIVTTIVRLSNTVEPLLVKHLQGFGLALTDLRLLVGVQLHSGIAQKTLAAKTGLSQAVVSSRLDRMEHFGWITRSHVGRRLVALELTATGAELLSLIVESLEGAAPIRALAELTDDEEEAVLRGIRRLVQVWGPRTEGHQSREEKTGTDPPTSSVTHQLVRASSELDQALEDGDYELNDSVSRLGDELDDLIRAYLILSKGRRDSTGG